MTYFCHKTKFLVIHIPEAIYNRLAGMMCSLLVVMSSYIRLIEVWYNSKFDRCCEINQINHPTLHI